MKAALFLLAALAGGLSGAATAASDEPPSVNVNSLKNPEMHAYRSVWAGLDAFEAHHALAPSAPLKFRILRPDGSPVSTADGLALRLAGAMTRCRCRSARTAC